ncbi:DUF7594 domain-containing protein [Rariglobus hedericola]|nr:DNRLRE domain-containing protein [Rariglobus hedericola]
MKTPPTPPCSPGRSARFQRIATTLFAGTLLAVSAAYAQTSTIYGLTADRQVNSAGTLSDGTPMQAGYSGTTAQNAVVVFQLPTLPAGKEFDAASLRLYFAAPSGTPSFNGDLYALGVSASSAVQSGDYYSGALDAGAVRLQDNLVTPSATSGARVSNAADLTDFLNAAYDKGARAGQYVFFRVSPDVAGLNNYTRYNLYSREYSGGSFYWPSLTYGTADIPPSWVSVPLGGGGYVTGLISDPTGADVYCRTDVGGAFKWNAAGGNWDSITDVIVPTSTPAASALTGTTAIALDPSNSNNLYVATGGTGSLRGIYASTDKGATWTIINNTISMDGNGGFRSYGERLAVDPNNPSIVWFGSSFAGLYKGTKSGGTWTWMQVASTSVPFGDANGGVTFVACDKNGSSTIVYAGVFDSAGTTGGIYKSTDGVTWSKVPGATFARPARGQVAANGTLYATGFGSIARLVRGGSLEDITPAAGVDYRGLGIAQSDTTGNIIYVAEASAGTGRVWRTATAAAATPTWAVQSSTSLNNNGAITRQEPDGTPTLTGYWFGKTSSLLVNPTNPNELWAGDFFGVARTQNAQLIGGTTTGNEAIWYMLQKGQEETVVETVKNAPTGPLLLTGVADVGGFRYNDLTVRPYGTGGNGFGGGNTTSLDFSEANHSVWALGWYGTSAGGSGAYSKDAGASWLYFGGIDRRTISSGTGAWETWDLTTYLAAQKAKGVSTVTLMLATTRTTNYSSTPLLFDSREAADPSLRPKLVFNGTTTVTATSDTYVYGSAATTNYGNAATLGVSHTYSGVTTYDRQVFLKFDLTAAGAISSASLQLHRVTAAAGFDYTVTVYACASTSWVEGDGGTDNLPASEVNWNNRPKPYASSSGRPIDDPRYLTGAGVSLNGGRVAVSSTNPDRMVWMGFGTSTVPHYSNDDGVTWMPCTGLPANINRLAGKSNPSYLIQQVTADRVNGQFYMSQLSSGGGSHTIYRSTDQGATWAAAGTISAGTYNTYRTQIVAAPAANEVWFCDDGVNGTTAGGLWKSTNGAVSWTKMTGISAVRQVAFGKAASGSGYTVFFNGCLSGVQGVYRSDDYGSTWTRLVDVPSVVSIESLAGDRQNYGRVFIGTGGRGVFHGKN